MHQQTSSCSFSVPLREECISHSPWIGGYEVILFSVVVHTREKYGDLERLETRGDLSDSGRARHLSAPDDLRV